MRRLTCLIFLAVMAPALFGAKTSAPKMERSPQDDALRSYKEGLKYRDRAWKAEKELADPATEPAKKAKLEEAVRKSYEAAIRSQQKAIDHNPALVQAHTELGYALRKTGDFDAALAAYDKALSITPGYAEAIEYRAEAYLGLNRVDEAKQAYMTLFNGGDPKNAALLAEAMQKWVSDRRSAPDGVAAEKIDALAKWLDQRAEISKQAGVKTAGSGW